MAENDQACLLCGDTTPKHRHYTILCYEDGRCLGQKPRLTDSHHH